MKSNEKDRDDVCYVQPKTLDQRVAIANDFSKRFKYPLPFAIDEMTNAANDAYAAWPERLYIIDENGRVSYKGGNGPFKYDPKEVRVWLAQRYGEVFPSLPPGGTQKTATTTTGTAQGSR